MTIRFNRRSGLITVTADVYGPTGVVTTVRLAVDTGSTLTVINVPALTLVGYDSSLSKIHRPMATAAGMTSAPQVTVVRFKVLGEERIDFPVLAHSLPPASSARGLLGLDFFRDRSLTLDFRLGQLTLR